MPRPRIYVAIAAYRDRETAPTLNDLYARAAHPERVNVGICWQGISPDDDAIFPHAPAGREGQVRTRAYDARESRGAGWARNIAHGLREGEEYTLQLDSHMRFHDGWDETLLDQLARCASDRPVLSTYPASYEPPGQLSCGVYALQPSHFDHDGIVNFAGRPIWSPVPVPSAFLAGGLIFSSSEMFDQIPYDPMVYFIGEEIGLAARAWTHGWDFFAPNVCIIHHYYGRSTQPKHWSDHGSGKNRWTDANRVSQDRVRQILGTRQPADLPELDALGGPLGLGGQRTIADYQRFAGLDFMRQVVRPKV